MKYKTRVWHPFHKDDYYWAWHKTYLWGVIRQFFRDIRRSHQRIWRGYCDYDLFSIDYWFLVIMPTMLQEFKDTQHGCPVMPGHISHKVFLDKEDGQDDEALAEWKAVLDRMIFLLKEAEEETCSRQNPYEDEYFKAWQEFDEKYGPWGEKLSTPEERDDIKNHRGRRIHFPDEVDEYKELGQKYMEEEHRLSQYRVECKDEALALFSKWFYDLWD